MAIGDIPGPLHVFLPFVYSGQEDGNGLPVSLWEPWLGDRASGEQGDLESSEQEGLNYISAGSAQFQGTTLIDYLTVIANTAQRDQQINPYFISGENGVVHYVPMPKTLVYRVERRNMAIASILCIFCHSLCSCGMWQVGQHSSLGGHTLHKHTLPSLWRRLLIFALCFWNTSFLSWETTDFARQTFLPLQKWGW